MNIRNGNLETGILNSTLHKVWVRYWRVIILYNKDGRFSKMELLMGDPKEEVRKVESDLTQVNVSQMNF